MQIKKLFLQNFRNYGEETFEFSDGLNILFGKNGQGKTNCAEAVFYLCTGASLRIRHDKQLIKLGSDVAKIKAEAENRYGKVTIEADILESKREIRVNGSKISKNADLMAVFAAIHLDAVKNNIEQMEKMISDKTGILCVIKTDGYGHGAVPVASVLESEDCVAGFAVATAEEAIELRDADINKPVLVLGYTFPQDYDELIYRNVRMTIFRRDTLKKLSEAVERLNSNGISCKALVHIKVDTGMGRIGIMPDDEGLAFVEEAMSCKGIEVEGIFTHFARADETDKTSAVEQYEKFIAFVNRAEKTCGKAIPYKHCANSAAILELPQTNMDLVRAGIAMYGLWPSDEVKKEIALQPVLSLHSHIVYCKEVPTGTPISYGGTYVTDKVTRVATVPVGYGDGYPRALSNIGHVLV